jgi:hypothetical protein
MRRGLASLAVALGTIAIVVILATACQVPGLRLGAVPFRVASLASADAGPTPALYQAIKEAAAEETHGSVHLERIDYVGRHDNGGGSVGYIFYVYFSDAAALHYERFIRVLRTADGALHVLTA